MVEKIPPLEWYSNDCQEKVTISDVGIESIKSEVADKTNEEYLNAEEVLGNESIELNLTDKGKIVTLEYDNLKLSNIDDETNLVLWLEVIMVCESNGSIQITLNDYSLDPKQENQYRDKEIAFQDCLNAEQQTKKYKINGASRYRLPAIQVENRSLGKVRLAYTFRFESIDLGMKMRSSVYLESDFEANLRLSNLSITGRPVPPPPSTGMPPYSSDSSFLLLVMLFFCLVLGCVVLVARVAAGRGNEAGDQGLVLVPELLEKNTAKCQASQVTSRFNDGS